jgi:hypothetical protein
MSDPVPVWQRSAFVSGGSVNQFQLFCFAPGPLRPDVPMSASRFGLPSAEAMAFVEVRELARGVDPQWFDGFRSGSLRALATQALGSPQALDQATQLTAVLVSRPDAAELVHLQAGWAVAQWLIARGVTVVLDAQANRFWSAAEVADWPATRPLALSSEVNVIVEAEPTASVATIHTRGLGKFGRPDLVVLNVPGSRWDAVAGLVRTLAGRQVDGALLRAGEQVTVDGNAVKLEAFRPTRETELHLNNEALLLTAGA